MTVVSESFNEEVEAFRKACNGVRLKPPGPDKIQALRELTEKQRKKHPGETRKEKIMKMIYDKKLNGLLDPANMFIGDVDPLMNTSTQVAEILLQNRPLLQKDAEDEEKGQERFGVWVCYVADRFGDLVMVKLVSTDVQAMEWVQGRPRTIGLMDDEMRGNRFVEYHTVEVERP